MQVEFVVIQESLVYVSVVHCKKLVNKKQENLFFSLI